MTAQIPDRIEYRGQTFALCATPLSSYLGPPGTLRFVPTRTSCWRGYVARWLIEDNGLFLIDVRGSICVTVPEPGDFAPRCGVSHDGPCEIRDIGMADIFPNADRVLAEWYSGTLRIPLGPMARYVHMDFESVFERYLMVEIVAGRVVTERVTKSLSDWGAAAKNLVHAMLRVF